MSKFRTGGHLMRDQTVGSNIREGGDALVNRSSWDRYRLGHQPVDSEFFFSELAQCTVRPTLPCSTSGRRVWLLVIREVEKTPLGSLETSCIVILCLKQRAHNCDRLTCSGTRRLGKPKPPVCTSSVDGFILLQALLHLYRS